MLASIGINYTAGLLLGKYAACNKKKVILWADIFLNIAILYCFKYLDYTIKVYNFVTKQSIPVFNIVLPIGISFFTFQAMSYVIDVYRRDAEPEKNILNVGLYISFFPQLVAGPIVRYNMIAEQIKQRTEAVEMLGGYETVCLWFLQENNSCQQSCSCRKKRI